MSVLLNFLNRNKRELVQIYTKERQHIGKEGLLWVIETPDHNANVSYVIFEDLPVPLLEEIKNLKEKNLDDSIIYFYICDPLMAQIIEIDLRNFNPEKSIIQLNDVNTKTPEITKNELDTLDEEETTTTL
jgi:hypothetical protein